MVTVAKKASTLGVTIAAVTTSPLSEIAGLSDLVITIPTSTCKRPGGTAEIVSRQPGANAFEQCTLLIVDALTNALFSDGDVEANNALLMTRHANLE